MSAPRITAAPPSVDRAFLLASDAFERTVAAVPPEAWAAPSPCEGWTVRDVVGHVVQSTQKIAALVADQTFDRGDEPPSVAAGADPLAALRDAGAEARDAIRDGDLDRTTDAMNGSRTVASALGFPIADLAVHAWDVGHATGQDVRLPDELLAFVVEVTGQVPEEVLRSPGRFGPAVPVADHADDTTRLMAWLGRDPSDRPVG